MPPTLPRLESGHFHLIISDQNVCVLKWVIRRERRLSPVCKRLLENEHGRIPDGEKSGLLSTGGLMGWVRLKGEPGSL